MDEIKQRIRRLKNNVASGVDGVRKKDIVGSAALEVLHLLFNICLTSAKQPQEWRKNRTTLLLKDGKDGRIADNYRPITISSLISRVYYGIIDNRIRGAVQFSPRQKGFVAEPGCFTNVHILNELLRHSKASKGLVLTQVDISKAFDTVPHCAIAPALRRKGLPAQMVSIVTEAYKDATVEVSLQRGVKQGDPLSPTIFNLVMDGVLDKLESHPGYSLGSEHISSLAFVFKKKQATPAAQQQSERRSKVPPIVLREKDKYDEITRRLMAKKLIMDANDTYKHQYHTYQLEEEKQLRLVIRGVIESWSDGKIRDELIALGFHPTTIPIAVVLVLLPKSEKAIFDVRSLGNLRVRVESQHAKSQLTQCFRCQLYGHVQSKYTAAAKCVTCAAAHESRECPVPRERAARQEYPPIVPTDETDDMTAKGVRGLGSDNAAGIHVMLRKGNRPHQRFSL
ncbi:hypothetical protein YQE_02764, partial [Dendroctonus ponderosae]